MTQPQSNRSFSRRTALAGLGASALGVALATRHLSAFAQDSSPVPTPFPMQDHPIIGIWQITLEPGIPSSSIVLYDFDADGRLIAALSEDQVAVGSWRATGERTADMILHQQDTNPPDFFAPDYAGAGPELLPTVWLWQLAITIDPTGNTMLLAGKIDFYNDGVKEEESYNDQKSEGVRMVPVDIGGTPAS